MRRRSNSHPITGPRLGSPATCAARQPILSMVALECGLDTVLAAEPLGGMAALRRKSLALTDLFIQLVEEALRRQDLELVTPREHERRGSQVCLTREEGAYAIMQALIARGVIGDYRAALPPSRGRGMIRRPATSCVSASRRCTPDSRTSGTR